MKDTLFKKICIISDGLLRDQNSNSTTIAIRSLHIIKNHPDYFTIKKRVNFIEIFFLFFKRIFFSLINSLLVKKNFKNTKFKKKKIIIISHLINKENKFKKEDFYYGNLQKILNKNHQSNYKVFCNHINYHPYFKKNNFSSNTIVLNKYLNFSGELSILKDQILESFRLIKILLKTKNSLKKKIVIQAIFSLFEEQTLFALQTSRQLKILLAKIKPKLIISTYEGYSWERLCFKTAKNISKKIFCIGYQHAPIIKSNYSIKRNLYNNYDPDYIWCSSKNSYDELSFLSHSGKSKLFNFGNLKNVKKNKFLKKKNKFLKSCLVIPEGTQSECLKLFNFSLLCAEKNMSYRFIWRVHPIIKIEKVLKKLNLPGKKLPSNVEISKNNLIEADLKKTYFTLYRGSGAIINCVALGNIPLYLNNTKNANIDPLYKLNIKKNYISNEDEFIKLCNFHVLKNRSNLGMIKDVNRNYCKKLEINKLIKFINKFK